MTVKTTLSFTDRHHRFLADKVDQGVFASQSAAVSAAIELMMQEETEWQAVLVAMADEIRARMATPRDEFLDEGQVADLVGARIAAASKS